MKRIATLAFLLLFVVSLHASAKTPTGIAARRWGWFYGNGAVRKVSLQNWREKGAGGDRLYKERVRNEQYIELHAVEQKYIIRLYDSSMWLWQPESRNWRPLHSGRWDDPR